MIDDSNVSTPAVKEMNPFHVGLTLSFISFLAVGLFMLPGPIIEEVAFASKLFSVIAFALLCLLPLAAKIIHKAANGLAFKGCIDLPLAARFSATMVISGILQAGGDSLYIFIKDNQETAVFYLFSLMLVAGIALFFRKTSS